MVKIFFLKIILILVLTGCDYTPIYSTKDGQFNIKVLSYEGDREINSKILSKLRIHKNINSELVQIKFNTTTKKMLFLKTLLVKQKNISWKLKRYTIIINELEKNYSINETLK